MPVRVIKYFIGHFEEVLVVLLQVIMVCCLTYSAVVRYFVTLPLFTSLSHKAEELALFSFIALLYFGAALAVRKNAHFRITAQFRLIPPRWRKYAFIPGECLWQALNLFVVFEGWLLVKSALVFPEPSLSLQIPMWIIYLIIPLSFLLMSLRLFQRQLRGEFGAAEEQPAQEALPEKAVEEGKELFHAK